MKWISIMEREKHCALEHILIESYYQNGKCLVAESMGRGDQEGLVACRTWEGIFVAMCN
jgi:hypothetical protein